jgi:hypothetical protein
MLIGNTRIGGIGSLSIKNTYDADALNYLTAVEVADGQALENSVKIAINTFVVGCKADGIWSAIKASCIMAGARTLSGALVPLAGIAPTNTGFISGDYNRKNGITGSGTGKYLDSGYTDATSATLPQNNSHISVYVTANPLTATRALIGSTSAFSPMVIQYSSGGSVFSKHKSSSTTTTNAYANGFLGISRNISTDYTLRTNSTNYTITRNSSTATSSSIFIFAEIAGSSTSNATISFYSLGENIDLSLLNSRLATLMNTFASVIS